MEEKMKLLLFQIRKETEMADHELRVIAGAADVSENTITRVNVAMGERVDISELDKYDGVMIGGSGGFSVLDNTDFNEYLRDVARHAKEKNIPFLGICYGFQIAVQAFGGTVIHDLPNTETGSFAAYRDSASDNDPLIGSLPRQFDVACGRQDRAEVLPPGAVNYLHTDRVPYYYITFPGTNFYAVQFHPELWKKEDNLIRITFYREKYCLSLAKYQEQIKMFQDAPESAAVLKNFIQNVVVPNMRAVE